MRYSWLPRTVRLSALGLLALLACSAAADEAPVPASAVPAALASTFDQQLPRELAEEVRYAVDQVAGADPLAPADRAQMEQHLAAMSENRSDEPNAQLMAGAGPRVLLFIDEVLRTGDLTARRKGIIVLSLLVKPHETRNVDDILLECNLVLPMCLRSGYDVDPTVRRYCAGLMGSIASVHRPVFGGRLLPALRRLLTDPDPAVVWAAATSLHSMGEDEGVPEELLREFGDWVE